MNITGKLIARTEICPEVVKMDQALFPNPWTEGQWTELDLAHHALYTWNNNSLIGFALFGVAPNDDVAHLYKILIKPSLRGGPETQAFWIAISETLKLNSISKIYLEVECSNQRAIGFYEKCGFSLLRKARSYYSNGEDGLMMELTL